MTDISSFSAVNREDSLSQPKAEQDVAYSTNDFVSMASPMMSSVMEDPELFGMCLDKYEPPEIINRGLVSPEEVCQLFEMYEGPLPLACASANRLTSVHVSSYFDKMNDAKTLDPVIHNIPALLTRCPLLFTVSEFASHFFSIFIFRRWFPSNLIPLEQYAQSLLPPFRLVRIYIQLHKLSQRRKRRRRSRLESPGPIDRPRRI